MGARIPREAPQRRPGDDDRGRCIAGRRGAGAPLQTAARAMSYVLDTNAVSALMKGSAAVVERLAANAPTDVAIPQPVIAELAFGIERLPRSRRRSMLQSRFDLLCSELPRAEWTDAVSHA